MYAERRCERLVDPFVGGASSILSTCPTSFVAADVNAELIGFLSVLTKAPEDVVRRALAWPDSREVYYDLRARSFIDPVDEAARFLYLNRTAYLGMYRVNRAGHFNVPYGGGGRLRLADLAARAEAAACVFARGSFIASDFRSTLGSVSAEDFVVLDPPYGTRADGPFGRYDGRYFTDTDHADLAEAANGLSPATAVVLMLSPDAHTLSRYAGWWIAAARVGRAGVRDLVLTSWRPPRRIITPPLTAVGRKVPCGDAALHRLVQRLDRQRLQARPTRPDQSAGDR